MSKSNSMKKLLIILFINVVAINFCAGQEYNASLFGCVSDGITDNTGSIQYAIDFIAKKGGGTLNFYVGRYLTGGLELKSKVTIHLHEGAVLVASPNINNFLLSDNERALLFGKDLTDVSIIGKGVIEANPQQYFFITDSMKNKGFLQSDYFKSVPSLLTMINCSHVKVEGIIFQKTLRDAQKFIHCKDVDISDLTIESDTEGNNGLLFRNTKGVSLKNIFIDTKGKAIIKDKNSELVKVENCTNADGKSIL